MSANNAKNAKNDTNLMIRTNSKVKKAAQEVFSALGVDMSTAVNIFLRQAIYSRGFPFEVRLSELNDETLKAIAEGERMITDPTAPRFSTVEALFEDLDAQ